MVRMEGLDWIHWSLNWIGIGLRLGFELLGLEYGALVVSLFSFSLRICVVEYLYWLGCRSFLSLETIEMRKGFIHVHVLIPVKTPRKVKTYPRLDVCDGQRKTTYCPPRF